MSRFHTGDTLDNMLPVQIICSVTCKSLVPVMFIPAAAFRFLLQIAAVSYWDTILALYWRR